MSDHEHERWCVSFYSGPRGSYPCNCSYRGRLSGEAPPDAASGVTWPYKCKQDILALIPPRDHVEAMTLLRLLEKMAEGRGGIEASLRAEAPPPEPSARRCASPETPPGECDAFEAGETSGMCPPGFCATAPEPSAASHDFVPWIGPGCGYKRACGRTDPGPHKGE